MYLDEQRITSAIATADPRTFDMQRVEVLRGPQGTLFGGGSLAGTLRYITNRADVTRTEGNVALTLSSTEDGSENGSFDGMYNLPLIEDTLAVRFVGYYDDRSGYLENSLLGLDDVAGIENQGGRIGIRYTPSEALTIDYKYLLQDLEQSGFPEARGTDVDALQQGGVTMTPELLTSKFSMHDLTWEYDLGPAAFTSSTGYLQFDFVRRNDVSLPLIRDFTGDDSLSPSQAIAAVDPSLRLYINDDNDNYTFSQEFRLMSDRSTENAFQWLLGAYYEEGEESVSVGDFFLPGGGAILGTADVNGQPADFLFKEDFVTSLSQYAAFGEFSYEVADGLVVTLGYRYSNFKSSFEADALIGDEPDDDGNALRDIIAGDPFTETFDTFKFNVSYDVNESVMAYFQSAEGFRLGFGSEVPPPLNPGCETFVTDFLTANGLGGFLVNGQLPGTTSDTLWVHEAGIKGRFNGGRGTFATSAFYGDWSDIQVEVEIDDITGACNTGFTANAASATSVGIEAEFSYIVTEQLTISGSGSWVEATVDNDEPFLGATADERLPGSPDLQLSVSADYTWALAGGMEAFVRADAQYIGEILGSFEFGEPRTESGEYGLANLRGGVRRGPYEFTLFIDNAFDNRGEVFSNGFANEFRRTILLRPRTTGISFRTRF